MAELIFTHPKMSGNALKVRTKPDSIFWGYGLNTANYPTYGGEVVQILSCYIDDLTVKGMVGTYAELEKIYSWFITFMHLATQGEKGHGSYNTDPVVMHYPERGWTFDIIPKSLPGFKYGRDVVAPEWTMIAAVKEPDEKFKSLLLQNVEEEIRKSEQFGEKELFGKVTAGIGYSKTNPFQNPDAQVVKKEKEKQQDTLGDLADWFNNLIPAYLDNDFSSIEGDYSKPVYLDGKKGKGEREGNINGGNNGR